MKRLGSLITGIALTLFGTFGLVSVVSAPVTAVPCNHGGFLTFPAWSRGLECESNAEGTLYVVVNDIPQFVWTIALNMLEILLQVVGIIAIVMILVSAFKYLTNGGNEQKIIDAKTSLMQAVVGLAIALLASTIIGFVMSGLSQGL